MCLWSDAGQLEQKKGGIYFYCTKINHSAGRQFPDTAANNISSTRLLKSISNRLKYITLVPQNNFQFDSSSSLHAVVFEVGYNHKRVQLNDALQTSKSRVIKSKVGSFGQSELAWPGPASA